MGSSTEGTRTNCVTGRSRPALDRSRIRMQSAHALARRKVGGGELGIKADTLRGWAKRAQVDRQAAGTSTADAARMRALA